MLLGRPWQYDRRVIYDGYKNIYRIRKDGQEYLLLPMTSEEVQRERYEHVRVKGQRSLFLFPCRFEKRTKPQNSQEKPMKQLDSRTNHLQEGENDMIRVRNKSKSWHFKLRTHGNNISKLGRHQYMKIKAWSKRRIGRSFVWEESRPKSRRRRP